MFWILQTFQIDCFKLNSQAMYDKQRDVVNFTAMPSPKLAGDELKYCSQTMNGQNYDLTIQLGHTNFFIPDQTYNNSDKISVLVPCQEGSNCSYAAVQNVQASVYIMTFTKLNINISFIIGEYAVQMYDHTDCLGGAIMIYDSIQNIITMEYKNKAVNCTLSGSRYNYTYQSTIPGLTAIPLKNAARSYITTYFNGLEALSNQIPFLIYSIAFPQSNITAQTNPDDLINDLVALGPLKKSVLPEVVTTIAMLQQDKLKTVFSKIMLGTTVVFGTGPTSTKMDFNTTVSYYITDKYNVKQDDCLTNVSLLLLGKDFQFKAQYNKTAQRCGKAYMEKLKLKYDSIYFYLQVIQNGDYTGLYYQKTFDIPEYELGDDINYKIVCSDEKDCDMYLEIIELYNNQPNCSFIMQQVYSFENATVLRTAYPPKVVTMPSHDMTVILRQDSICVTFQPSDNDANTVRVQFGQSIFEYQFFASILQQKYCQEYSAEQKSTLVNIVQNKSVSGDFNVYLNQYHLSSANATVYYLPNQNTTAWIIMGMFFMVIIIIGIVLLCIKLELPNLGS